MFTRDERLIEKRIFTRLLHKGTWARGYYFSVRFVPSQPGPGQIAFVISRKVTKQATVRNRMRRQLRAVFYAVLHREQFERFFKRHHLLVVVHKPFVTVPYSQLITEAEAILTRIPSSGPV